MIGDIHARTLRASLTAGLGYEPGEELRAVLDAEHFASQWHQAITAPPSGRHRVLTALDGARVVGFTAYAPAEVLVEIKAAEPEQDQNDPGTAELQDRSAPSDARAPSTAEILALEVPAAEQRRGHGSRLLAACADLLRDQGIERVQVWIVRDDESRTRFLAEAGFAPAGARRTLDVAGDEVEEICWYAGL